MKRLFLFLFFVFVVFGLTTAQTTNLKKQNFLQTKSSDTRGAVPTKVVPNAAKDENVVWTCDFEEGCPSYVLTSEPTSQSEWAIITESEYPEEMIRPRPREWYMPPLNFSGRSDLPDAPQQLSETPEHWAFLDAGSDKYSTPPIVDASIIFTELNLSSCQNPKVVFIQSYKSLNAANEAMYVSTSTDGGRTWTDHRVNEGIESYAYASTVVEVLIPEAGGVEEVQLKFQYASTSGWHYAWQLDDIKILEIPNYNLTLENARISMYGYIDYRDEEYLATIWSNIEQSEKRDMAYQINDPYAVSPINQWATNNGIAAFNVEVTNNGCETVVPKVNVKVTSPSGEVVYNKTLAGNHSLATGETDTIDFAFTGNFSSLDETDLFYFAARPDLGRYVVEFNVSSDGNEDSNSADNTNVQYFYLSENNFCTVYEEPTSKARVNSSVESATGDEYGTLFTYYYSPDDLLSVDIFVAEGTTVGNTRLKAKLYETIDDEYVNKAQTEIFTITEDVIGKWVNLQFEDEFFADFLADGEAYHNVLLTIYIYIEASDDYIYLGSTDVLPTRAHNNLSRPYGDENWYYGNPSFALNLHSGEMTFGDGNSNGNDNNDVVNSFSMSNISMYPNPTSGMVQFENVAGANIEIVNLLGQVVAQVDAASENVSIDLNNVSNGNYLVKIVKDNVVSTSKLNIVR